MSASKKNTIIICSVLGTVVLIFVVMALFVGKIPMNDENTVGNTAGNLNNGGLFCESDGVVYFSNAYDNDSLYSMNTDESDIKKLGVNSVSYINVGGDFLYYYMESGIDKNSSGQGLGYMGRTAGIYRSNKNGKHTVCLDRSYSNIAQLCGNYIYYQAYNTKTGSKLNKVKIDNSEPAVTIADYIINPASYYNGKIYFNGTEDDHYLRTLNISDDTISTLWEGNIWNPVYLDNYVYYMDVLNNYRLCRYSLSDDVVEVLTEDRIDFFNVYDYYIYYQTNSETEPALKRMYIDGSNPETVAEGIYENINITSEYVYFNEYDIPTPVYRTSTFGNVAVGTFDAAAAAATQNSK